MEWTDVVVHYDELGLKGKNRHVFEDCLIRNIKHAVKNDISAVRKEYGQIILGCEKGYDASTIEKRLRKIPGIAFFSFAIKAELDLADIKEKALGLVRPLKMRSFKIDARRHNKMFSHDSQAINCEVGAYVQKSTGAKVKLKDPHVTICVEICDKNAYLSLGRVDGIGGLPVGTACKVVCLLSGGLDSPVASWMMMKRGAKAVFVHFSNDTGSTGQVKGKIRDLVKILSDYQGGAKLHIVPFGGIQKQIIMSVNSKFRTLVYRRFMVRIACEIAKREHAKAIVLGDNLSQVASQTAENLEVAYVVSSKLVFSPLIGFNKNEIIQLSKDIGTYDVSIQPYPDCCSFFTAKHPEIKATPKELERVESTLDVSSLVDSAVKSVSTIELH